MGVAKVGGRFMMVEHTVGEERVEVPAIGEDCTGLGVRHVEQVMFDVAQLVVVPCEENESIFLGCRGQQCQAADVVQQSGQIGFFRVAVADLGGDFPGQGSDGQRVFPEGTQIGPVGMREVVENLHHRLVDDEGADHVGAECRKRGFQSGRPSAAVIGRAVGDSEYLAGQSGIAGNQVGQCAHACVIGLAGFHQFEKNLGHDRQTGREQAATDIGFKLMHCSGHAGKQCQ